MKPPEQMAEEYAAIMVPCARLDQLLEAAFLAGYERAMKYQQEGSQFIFSSIKPPKEMLRIKPTETGWDMLIPEDVTLTEAAQKFIETVNGLVGKQNKEGEEQ